MTKSKGADTSVDKFPFGEILFFHIGDLIMIVFVMVVVLYQYLECRIHDRCDLYNYLSDPLQTMSTIGIRRYEPIHLL